LGKEFFLHQWEGLFQGFVENTYGSVKSMHELAVTQSLIRSVLSELEQNNVDNPKGIVVELGLLTSYVKDSILFYYDLIRKDIPSLAHVDLIIHEVPGKIICRECNTEQTIQDPYLIFCKQCHSTNVDIIQGKEFIIKKIILEK